MKYIHKGIEYRIVYEIEDLHEHMYLIGLQNESGEEFDVEYENTLNLSYNQQIDIYRMVDEDAWSNAIDAAEYAYGDR